jgi:hypothetical protein
MTMKAAWSLAALLATPAAAHADVANGSFESQDFAGWTVTKSAPSGTFATAAVALSGSAIGYGAQVYDHIDQTTIANYSSGLPLVPHPTDGVAQALLLQNGPSTTRLSQVVNVPANAPELTFDLGYHNWDSAFSAAQSLAVQIRDPESDALLATVYQAGGVLESPMTHQTIDMADYAGMQVRLQFEVSATNNFFDVQLDHVDLQGRSAGPAMPDMSISADTNQTADEQPADLTVGGGCSTGKGGASLLAALALVTLRRRRR